MKEQAYAYHQMYQRIKECIPERNMSVTVSADSWEQVTSVWRNAWHDVKVSCCYDNRYRYRGKHLSIKHLYFPEQLIVLQFELGRNRYYWGNVIHLTEEFQPDGRTCIITRKKDKGDLSNVNFVEALAEKNGLEKGLASAFVRCYQRRLISLGIQSNTTERLMQGWTPVPHQLFYYFAEPLQGYEPQHPRAGVLKLRQHSDAACLFFAATVFSLLKLPMRSMMKNKAEQFQFALYVSSGRCVSADEFFEYVLHYANLYCNFRSWDDSLSEEYRGAKFCYSYPQECNRRAQLAWWNHLHFPVVFSNAPIKDEPDDDYEMSAEEQKALEKKRHDRCGDPIVYDLLYGDDFDEEENLLIDDSGEDTFECAECAEFNLINSRKHLKKLSCLPILVMREGAEAEEKRIKAKNILTLPVDVDTDFASALNLCERHRTIMGGYIGLLEKINRSGAAEFRTACKEASKAAYRDLGILKKDAVREQHYQAKLLCSIYIAEHYAEEKTLFWVAVKDTLAYLKKHIAHQAAAEDFARFLRHLGSSDEDKTVLFHQDDTGIYLHYKQYWPVFQKYCKDNGIVLSASAAKFRKTTLKNYIKPQYQASGANYLRYDYRKKVDGREAVVLNVNPKIMRLLRL